VLADLAAELAVPLVPMHRHLARHGDEGFLWWDFAHLTSFGQQLFAERLLEELRAVEDRGSPGGGTHRTLDRSESHD